MKMTVQISRCQVKKAMNLIVLKCVDTKNIPCALLLTIVKIKRHYVLLNRF
jgi:hypothetical protein